MAAAVRAVIFNADESYAATLRSSLLGFEGVKILAEIDEPAMLPELIGRFPADVLVANLDPEPELVIHMLGQATQADPDLLVFAVSESTDGQLILAAMRNGIREFIAKPIENSVLGEALEKVTGRGMNAGKQGKLITVIGGAGGVGATTLAVNLAVELKVLADGAVTVVDLDHRFGQVATALDVDPKYTLSDLCDSPEQLETQMIERALVRHASGLRVLSRPLHFAQADTLTAAHCVGALSTLLSMNDYVVVDGPTRFDFGAKAVLDISDYNLLLLQLVVPTVRSVHRMLQGMGEAGYNLERMRLVCNRVGCEGGGVNIEDVSATLNMEVFAEVPDEWMTVNAAMNIGEPLATHAPKSKVRQAICSIAQRLHNPGGVVGEDDVENKKRGLLSKIF